LQWIFPFASKFYFKKENGEKGWVEWHTHHARHHKLIKQMQRKQYQKYVFQMEPKEFDKK
jgi:hypothetical protein